MVRSLSILFFFTLLFSCNETGPWLKELQKKQIEKRYGSHYDEKEKIAEWEKSLVKYEAELSKQLKAGLEAGKFARKLGTSYGRMGQFTLCIQYLKKAIYDYGYSDVGVFYSLGLCQGSYAREHNWPCKETIEAEQTFAKVLNLNPKYHKAKFQLSLIWFHALAKENSAFEKNCDATNELRPRLRLNTEKLRLKAIKTMNEYKAIAPEDHRPYFALSGFYKIMGKYSNSVQTLESLIAKLKGQYANAYQKHPKYKQAQRNIFLVKSELINSQVRSLAKQMKGMPKGSAVYQQLLSKKNKLKIERNQLDRNAKKLAW